MSRIDFNNNNAAICEFRIPDNTSSHLGVNKKVATRAKAILETPTNAWLYTKAHVGCPPLDRRVIKLLLHHQVFPRLINQLILDINRIIQTSCFVLDCLFNQYPLSPHSFAVEPARRRLNNPIENWVNVEHWKKDVAVLQRGESNKMKEAIFAQALDKITNLDLKLAILTLHQFQPALFAPKIEIAVARECAVCAFEEIEIFEEDLFVSVEEIEVFEEDEVQFLENIND